MARGGPLPLDGWALLLVAAWCWHIVLAPFTKVEESFNLQAVHDICHYGAAVNKYDHRQFPGVVPRTFLGALVIALPACPTMLTLELWGATKLVGLYATRISLAALSSLGMLRLRNAVEHIFGALVGKAFVLLACVQFHLPFYSSRPLPNTLALPLVCWAVAEWLLRHPARVIRILAFTTLVVRCDLLPFAALVGLLLLLSQQISVPKAVTVGAVAAAASLAATVAVDSYFWGCLLWPEGSVLWFNTAENRSSEWGTQPWHWYFTSAIPRAMLAGMPLAACGLVLERRARLVTATVLAYVALYSLLPHKELRFLLPVLPVLNIPAACAIAWGWRNASKSRARLLVLLGIAASLTASLALTCLFAAVSRQNYPGGHALQRLHRLASDAAEPTVHIGVLPAMTGVSRFGEMALPWRYSKEEGISLYELEDRGFTYLLSESPSIPGYKMLEAIQAFSHIQLQRRPKELLQCLLKGQLPVNVVLQDSVFLHRRTIL